MFSSHCHKQHKSQDGMFDICYFSFTIQVPLDYINFRLVGINQESPTNALIHSHIDRNNRNTENIHTLLYYVSLCSFTIIIAAITKSHAHFTYNSNASLLNAQRKLLSRRDARFPLFLFPLFLKHNNHHQDTRTLPLTYKYITFFSLNINNNYQDERKAFLYNLSPLFSY